MSEESKIPDEEIQDWILEESPDKRNDMLMELSKKYQIKYISILRQLKDLLGEEEYNKRIFPEKEIIPRKEEEKIEEEKKIIYFEDLKFCKILKRTKKPFEEDWTNKPYTWQEIQAHIQKEVNYGILCGYEGLVIIDADTPALKETVERELPKTFTVKSGGGGMHFYYICPEVKKKIVLQTSPKEHFGEVQSWGAQCVAPGSIHDKTGRTYDIVNENDKMITELDYEKLLMTIKPFWTDVKEREKISIEELEKLKNQQKEKYGESDINNLSILDVITTGGFKKATNGELYGANPWHGSRTGMNFWINPMKNLAFCFRCSAGLNIAQAIALNEGIIHSCSDKLTNDQFFRVLEIAYNKYNLKKPEIEYADGSWIKKIVSKLTITELATEFGLTKCKECSQDLKFYDKNGRFSCNCGNHGNIVDITEMWIKNKKGVENGEAREQ